MKKTSLVLLTVLLVALFIAANVQADGTPPPRETNTPYPSPYPRETTTPTTVVGPPSRGVYLPYVGRYTKVVKVFPDQGTYKIGTRVFASVTISGCSQVWFMRNGISLDSAIQIHPQCESNGTAYPEVQSWGYPGVNYLELFVSYQDGSSELIPLGQWTFIP